MEQNWDLKFKNSEITRPVNGLVNYIVGILTLKRIKAMPDSDLYCSDGSRIP